VKLAKIEPGLIEVLESGAGEGLIDFVFRFHITAQQKARSKQPSRDRSETPADPKTQTINDALSHLQETSG